MSELRARIERGEYTVDPGAVAGSMLTKLIVIKRVRRRMLSEAGRSPQPIARLH